MKIDPTILKKLFVSFNPNGAMVFMPNDEKDIIEKVLSYCLSLTTREATCEEDPKKKEAAVFSAGVLMQIRDSLDPERVGARKRVEKTINERVKEELSKRSKEKSKKE